MGLPGVPPGGDTRPLNELQHRGGRWIMKPIQPPPPLRAVVSQPSSACVVLGLAADRQSVCAREGLEKREK